MSASATNDELKPGEDIAIRKQTTEEKERLNPEDLDIPSYRVQLNLDADQEKRLTDQFFMEFEAIEEERDNTNKLPGKWKERDAQYDGDMEANPLIPFNLHVHQSKIKTDAIARAVKEAFLDSDPVVDVSPRPDSGRKDGYQVAARQTEFLDYAMDEEIKPDAAFDKIVKSSIKKFVGIGKVSWAYRMEKRRREETYKGENVPVQVFGNRVLVANEGLEQFFSAYPESKDPNNDKFNKYKSYVKQLVNQKTIEIVVNYRDTVDNNAKLTHVKIEDFYVRNGCDYNEGLRTEHCIAERQTYTYWELLKKKDQEEFKNIEALWTTVKEGTDGSNTGELDPSYKTKEYDVLEATMYFKLKEDEEEVKIKAWFSKEKKSFLGAILYPYYAFDVDYIGFWPELNEYGFYGDARSVMYNLRDSNLAQNILLNLALYGLYIRNTITPIVPEGSEIAAQMADKTFQPGSPIVLDELTDDVNKAIGFVQWPNIDMNTTMALMELLRRDDSDTSKVSDLTSGRESTVDPTAPAAKTLALLQQSGLGVKEYIRTLLPSFNIFCTTILQIYYQMSQEGRKYQVRRKSEGVTGQDPFKTMSRDEMIVKTNVQARAASFVFDKVSEKQEAAAGYNTVMNNPEAQRNPALQHEAFTIFLGTLGQRWKNLADKLPTPEQFQQQQMQVAMQATKMYMDAKMAEFKNTGVKPEINMEELAGAITKAQAIQYNPALANPDGKAAPAGAPQ